MSSSAATTALNAAAIRSILMDAGVDFLSCGVEGKLGTVVRVEAKDRDAVFSLLRDGELAFIQMLDVFGADLEAIEAVAADTEKGTPAQSAQPCCIEITYYLRSIKYDHDIRIKMQLDYGASYRSVIGFFLSALLAERELCEMFGLTLLDHPNPKRLVTNEHFQTPLLKSVPIRGKEDVWTRG